ncbi:uncharacterized protein K441DRAFT_300081 [Cenococcum geophilum 1.58]|uniref:uncharacterized protein n=1 Tax=Cenococcum geophilum 1.58 TaxID=794803 RepID=UPI00358FD89E|nr:hypothetical protein K441DRAFT_300081 [Cenococcum geophilum 1.58]
MDFNAATHVMDGQPEPTNAELVEQFQEVIELQEKLSREFTTHFIATTRNIDALIYNSRLGETDRILEIVDDFTGTHFGNFPARLKDIRAWNGVEIHDFMIFLRCPNPLPRTDTCEGETKEQAIEQIKKKLGLPPAEPPKVAKTLPADHVYPLAALPSLPQNREESELLRRHGGNS